MSYWYDQYRVRDFTLDIDANPELARGQALLMGYLYRPYTANTGWVQAAVSLVMLEGEVACDGKRLPQLAAEVGMRDRDERLRPLAQRQTEQVDRAVLGDDPVHVAAGGDDAGARS